MWFSELLVVYAAHMVGYWAAVAFTVVQYGVSQQWSFECARVVLRNQVLYTPLVAAVPLWFPLKPLPGVWNLVWQAPVAVLLTDALFYPLHRLVHHPRLYSFHATHHTWTRPIGMSALYADRLEHCVVNVLPPLVAGMLARMDVPVLALWLAVASANTVMAHAVEGQHSDHHKVRNKNYGIGFYLVDRAMGTLKVD